MSRTVTTTIWVNDIYEPTNELRFLKVFNGKLILQQAWKNIKTGEYVWEDVPEVTEE